MPAMLVGTGYLISCALLLITNKLVVQRIPAPAAVHVIQFAFSAACPAVLAYIHRAPREPNENAAF